MLCPDFHFEGNILVRKNLTLKFTKEEILGNKKVRKSGENKNQQKVSKKVSTKKVKIPTCCFEIRKFWKNEAIIYRFFSKF